MMDKTSPLCIHLMHFMKRIHNNDCISVFNHGFLPHWFKLTFKSSAVYMLNAIYLNPTVNSIKDKN